jgi:D-glycero-D-manno-heptose 1,7-bisphosphate phosphatase
MKIVILDRDGVINHDSHEYIKNPDEWIPLDKSLSAIADLTKAGFQVMIATNQSGVGRGYYNLETLAKIHEKLHREVQAVGGRVTEIFFCPHHPDERCNCRKPQPGLLFQIRDKYGLDLSKTYFIGDSIVDIRAAKAAGCIPGLVLTGNGTQTLAKYSEAKQVKQFKDLAEVASFLIAAK